MPKSLAPNELIKDVIVNTINGQKPQTTSQLVGLIQKNTNLSEKEIINLLNQLEAEDKIHFDMIPEISASFGTYIFSLESAWFWIITAVALLTTFTVFTIPQDWFPFAYVRNVLGVIFVFFLPGYTLARAIFQKKVPIKTASESLDNIERLALSIAMSLALTPIIGLILYHTPFGVGLTPITLSLLTLTVLFAIAALTREYNAKSASF